MVSGMPFSLYISPNGRNSGVRCSGSQAYQLDNVLTSFILPLPPAPVLFPRKSLNRTFAVLLMRSAYDAADDLDFVAMDKFQGRFWKLRQSEVEPYTLQYRSLKVKYGDLTDPLYFDFISFAQFATISDEMRKGELVFEERNGAFGELRTVRRDASVLDNSQLPMAFTKKAGNLIYERLLEGFEGETFKAPRPCPANSDSLQLIEGINQILQLFVDQGYALKANLEEIKSEKSSNDLKLRIRLIGCSTLWGMQTLASRRALILTNFDSLAVKSFIEASLRTASYKTHFTDTYKEELWTVSG